MLGTNVAQFRHVKGGARGTLHCSKWPDTGDMSSASLLLHNVTYCNTRSLRSSKRTLRWFTSLTAPFAPAWLGQTCPNTFRGFTLSLNKENTSSGYILLPSLLRLQDKNDQTATAILSTLGYSRPKHAPVVKASHPGMRSQEVEILRQLPIEEQSAYHRRDVRLLPLILQTFPTGYQR